VIEIQLQEAKEESAILHAQVDSKKEDWILWKITEVWWNQIDLQEKDARSGTGRIKWCIERTRYIE